MLQPSTLESHGKHGTCDRPNVCKCWLKEPSELVTTTWTWKRSPWTADALAAEFVQKSLEEPPTPDTQLCAHGYESKAPTRQLGDFELEEEPDEEHWKRSDWKKWMTDSGFDDAEAEWWILWQDLGRPRSWDEWTEATHRDVRDDSWLQDLSWQAQGGNAWSCFEEPMENAGAAGRRLSRSSSRKCKKAAAIQDPSKNRRVRFKSSPVVLEEKPVARQLFPDSPVDVKDPKSAITPMAQQQLRLAKRAAAEVRSEKAAKKEKNPKKKKEGGQKKGEKAVQEGGQKKGQKAKRGKSHYGLEKEIFKAKWKWDGKGLYGPALNHAWLNSTARAKCIASMSASERAKRRLN